MKRYHPKEIESKWQKVWHDDKTYQADLDSDKPKYVGMTMFNYPSGAGIHMGHALSYTISDVIARAKRQQGYESYHPVGWDSFGLPAENYAIKEGISPQQSMAQIIPNYHKQYQAMGWSNDWSKEIAAHTPEYYKWTQWIFSEVYRAGLAYQDARQQWWCTIDKTVLANEQVIDGKSWRHDGPDDPLVQKREVKQWFFRITDYADEMLEATESLDWTDSVKTAQANWIGKSEGAEISFKVDGLKDVDIKVFTTRADTLFGASYIVLAPEHELAYTVSKDAHKTEAQEYVDKAALKSEVQRQEAKEKTGVFTGSYAVNPINDKKIPIWIADYVLSGYGTGAIMAVPAHDKRDNEFAKKFELPILPVIKPITGEVQENPEYRRSIVAIVYDKSKDRYLTIDWGGQGGLLFIGGGIDNDEDMVEAAKREIAEETGYLDLELVAQTPSEIEHHYFAHSKNVARKIDCVGLLFELKSDKKADQQLEEDEKDKFVVSWTPRSKITSKINEPLHRKSYELLVLEEINISKGRLINSDEYSGLDSENAAKKIVSSLQKKKLARREINYKIRDWSVSRQRYWGAPIPVVYVKDHGTVLVPDHKLPVELPEVADFQPRGDGKSVLASVEDWVHIWYNLKSGDFVPFSQSKPEGADWHEAHRETDTLDTYVCSSWYMLRYMDPHNDSAIFDSAKANRWMPIDFYNGADHATAHLIYARFITRFLHKQGLLDNPEPFKKFLFNGKVTAQDGTMFSKSKGNGVDPLEIISDGYGADALRTYLMFASPLELWTKWDPQGVPGTYRFLNRLWVLVQEFLGADSRGSSKPDDSVSRVLNKTIQKVTSDIDAQKYNTAISALMGAVNDLYKIKDADTYAAANWQTALEGLVQLVAPFAPHMAEELWQQLGGEGSVNVDNWPELDESQLVEDTVIIGVQINGKVRGELQLAVDADEQTALAAAKDLDGVKRHLEGKTIRKEIYIPGRILNIVAS